MNAFVLTVASVACLIVGANRFVRVVSDKVPMEWQSYDEFWRTINFIGCLFYIGVGIYLFPLFNLASQ